MAQDDIRMPVAAYTTSLGFRLGVVDTARRVAPDHRISLYGPVQGGVTPHAQLEFTDDLPESPEFIGEYMPRLRRLTLRLPLSDYDRSILLLRSGQPVFLEFNHFGDDTRQVVTSATLTTGTEPQ